MKIILLDIDGVLAPLGIVDSESTKVDLDGWSTIAIPNYNLNFLKYINEKVEVVWSSSWENTSNNICQMLNISDLKYINIGNNNHKYWNKLPGLIDFFVKNKEHEIIMIDDEIDINSESVISKYGNVKMLKTNPIVGLTIQDKLEIKHWIAND